MPIDRTSPMDPMSWQRRALRACIINGKLSALGGILVAIIDSDLKIDVRAKIPPFISAALVNKEGKVFVDVCHEKPIIEANVLRNVWMGDLDVALGTIDAIRDMFRRLADALKLSDHERTEMFTRLKQWVRYDERAISPEAQQ